MIKFFVYSLRDRAGAGKRQILIRTQPRQLQHPDFQIGDDSTPAVATATAAAAADLSACFLRWTCQLRPHPIQDTSATNRMYL